jgi:hypothetical protein
VTFNYPRQRSSLHKYTHLPDLTVLDFLFWEYIKDTVFMPPLVVTLPELAGRIRAAVSTITLNVLNM